MRVAGFQRQGPVSLRVRKLKAEHAPRVERCPSQWAKLLFLRSARKGCGENLQERFSLQKSKQCSKLITANEHKILKREISEKIICGFRKFTPHPSPAVTPSPGGEGF